MEILDKIFKKQDDKKGEEIKMNELKLDEKVKNDIEVNEEENLNNFEKELVGLIGQFEIGKYFGYPVFKVGDFVSTQLEIYKKHKDDIEGFIESQKNIFEALKNGASCRINASKKIVDGE